MIAVKEPTESEVRALRDAVYGIPISDAEWEKCKSKWMEPGEVVWLKRWLSRDTEVL